MKKQIEDHLRVTRQLEDSLPLLEAMADAILHCYQHRGCVYLLGNGGSAADAQHISAELLGRFKINRRPLPAVALTTDTSTLTAVANDLGADLVFARQVEALVTAQDVVWMLSVSGTSPNVIAAAKEARQRGATLIGFTSRRGHALAEYCTHCLMVDHDDSDRVQEMHCFAYHLVCERIEQCVASEG